MVTTRKRLAQEGIDNEALLGFLLLKGEVKNISRQEQPIAPIFETGGFRVYQYADRAIARFHYAVPFPPSIVGSEVLEGAIVALSSVIARVLFLRPELAETLNEVDELISSGVKPWLDTLYTDYPPSELISFLDQYESPIARSGRRGDLTPTKVSGVKLFAPNYLFLVEDEDEFQQKIPVCTGSFELVLAAQTEESSADNVKLFEMLTAALPLEHRRSLKVWTTQRFKSLCGAETRDYIARQLEGGYPHVFCQKTPLSLPPIPKAPWEEDDFEMSIRLPKSYTPLD